MCDWVNLAMADDSTVAGLLLRLHHRPPHLHWTVRQRRSTSTHKTSATRASPTTPLSWSGGNIDSHEEESSPPTKPAGASRSKVANPSESVTTKKPRRKKTLTELKEEESLLLKERKNLKNELTSLRLTVEQEIATNDSLKKMKLDLVSQRNSKTTTTSEVPGKAVCDPSQFVEAECDPSNSVYPKTVPHEVLDHSSLVVYAANASSKAQGIDNQESTFMLPDLNLPVDEDLSMSFMH